MGKTFPARRSALGEGGKSRLLLGKPFWSRGVGISHRRSLGTKRDGSAPGLRCQEPRQRRPERIRGWKWQRGTGCRRPNPPRSAGRGEPAVCGIEPRHRRVLHVSRTVAQRSRGIAREGGKRDVENLEDKEPVVFLKSRRECPFTQSGKTVPSDSHDGAARVSPGTAVTKCRPLHRALRPPSRRRMPGLAGAGREEPRIFPRPQLNGKHQEKKKEKKRETHLN